MMGEDDVAVGGGGHGTPSEGVHMGGRAGGHGLQLQVVGGREAGGRGHVACERLID